MSEQDDESFTLEPEQQTAARTLDRNITVEAGAGTGKTTTLTERYLTILRAHLDGPEALAVSVGEDEAEYRLPTDIEQITDPETARRLPEQIVVTTFTERAAEDLKQSIRAGIRDRLEEIDDRQQWELWRAAADGIEASYIHTIHGFCSRLLEEYATVHSKTDPKFDVLEEEDAQILVRRFATELVEEEPPEVQTLAPLFDRSKLVDVLTGLISERGMATDWIEHVENFDNQIEYESFLVEVHPFEPDPQQLLNDIEGDVETLCTLFEDDTVVDGVGKSSMKRVGRPLQAWQEKCERVDLDSCTPFERLSLCIDLCDLLTKGGNEAYGEGTYFGNKGFRTGDGDLEQQFATTMTSLLETLEPESRSIDAEIDPDRDAYEYLAALASLTDHTIDRYREHKSRNAALDYYDLISLTGELLGRGDSEEVDQIREQFRYVMVDEFQDTNNRQWRLFQSLVTDSEIFDGNNVFVVGDKKQSIYRFRDADVTVFDDAQEILETANARYGTLDDGSPLVTNFRTLPGTLAAINGLFERVFGYGGTEAYEAASEPLRPGRNSFEEVDPVVEYLPVPVDDELRDRLLEEGHELRDLPESEPADIEATAMANRIVELLDGDIAVSTDKASSDGSENGTGGSGRSVQPDDIAVLIRSRSALKDYERALRDASIPYTVVKGEGFFETPEIRALVSLFQALADPSDEIALYGTLRSPLCGLTDEDIAKIYDPDQPLWECIQRADDDTIRTVVADLKRWREYAGTAKDVTARTVESWRTLADQIVDETGYITAVAADERGQSAVANVDKFRELLSEFDAEGVPSLERVVSRLTEQSDQDSSEAEANVAEESKAVQIMTIHEAKGQEFPVVVIPGIGKQFQDKARISNGSVEFESVPVEDERVPILGLNVPAGWGEDSRGTLMRHVAQERRRAEEHAEEKRILYVACTRVEDHLILTGQHKSDDGEATGIEAPEPDDPSAMRDWVQPALFGRDEEAVPSWEKLMKVGQFRRELSYKIDGKTKHGEITVRRPPSAGSYGGEREIIEPKTQRSAYEYEQPWELQLSPSAMTGLAEGSQELVTDEETKQIRAESVDQKRNQAESGGEAPAISSAVFGQAVHRLCEMRPPRSEWPAFIRQICDEERSVGEDGENENLTEDVVVSIETAAERAVGFLDELHASDDVLATYDEFPIELSIPQGELRGYIDHLVVTEGAYHVVDYKTDRKPESEDIESFLERRGKHHEPQVLAYAAALSAADPERDVRVTLFFTDVDDGYSWESEETSDGYEQTVGVIRSELRDLDRDLWSL